MFSFHRFVLQSMRELVFGFEDSLVSTLGTVTGIAIGSGSTYIVILSSFVLIASESVSMAAGSYLSSRSAQDAQGITVHAKRPSQEINPVVGALVMGVSYVIGGCFPVLPYFFLSPYDAILPSVFLTLIMLFLVGWWGAAFTHRPRFRGAIQMVVISLTAAALGYGIGAWMHAHFVLPV